MSFQLLDLILKTQYLYLHFGGTSVLKILFSWRRHWSL